MIARGTAGGSEPVGLFFAIDLVVHLLPVGLYLDRQRYTVFWPYTEFESCTSRSSGGPLGNLSLRAQNLRRVFFFAPNKRSYTNSRYFCYQKCGGAVLKQKGETKTKT